MRLLLALLCLALASPVCAAPQSLSFARAHALLLERSDVLEAAAANTQSKRDTVDSLKTLWGPTISAQAFDYTGEARIDVDRKINTSQGEMPVYLNENKQIYGHGANLTGTWPLFTGGKIMAEKRAGKFALDEAEAQERAKRIEEEVKLIGCYFGLQLARAVEGARKDMLDQQKKELARAIEFEKHGMISREERLGVQVAKDKSEREWLKARDNSRIARIQLARLLRTESFGNLETPLFVAKNGLGSMREWVDATLAANPQIAAMEAQVKKSEQGVAAARGSFFPDLFAFGSYSFIRHYSSIIEPEWVAGLGLNFTLWDARGRLGGYRSARAVSREARAMRADITNQAQADAEVAWQNTRNAVERYELTAGNVALATENLKLKTAGFEEGLNTALDMTDARVQLTEALVDRKLAAYEFVVNYAILHAIACRMDDFLKSASGKGVSVEK